MLTLLNLTRSAYIAIISSALATSLGMRISKTKQPDPFESGCCDSFVVSISPEILRGFRINNPFRPCRPFRRRASEEFFPFRRLANRRGNEAKNGAASRLMHWRQFAGASSPCPNSGASISLCRQRSQGLGTRESRLLCPLPVFGALWSATVPCGCPAT
jgi:hypothetical protein